MTRTEWCIMEVCCCGPALPAASLASQCQLAMNERLLVVPAENHSLAVHYTDDLTRAVCDKLLYIIIYIRCFFQVTCSCGFHMLV